MTTVNTGRGRTPEEQTAHLQMIADDIRRRLDLQIAKNDANPSSIVDAKIEALTADLDAATAELNNHKGD